MTPARQTMARSPRTPATPGRPRSNVGLQMPPAAGSATPAITVTDLAKSFGEVRAVRGVNFEVASGEVFGTAR